MKRRFGREVMCGLILTLFQVLPGRGQPPQVQPGTFRSERVLLPGAAGPNRLRIDAELLAAAGTSWQLFEEAVGGGREPMMLARGGLRDLRIYDSSGLEVPYLLVAPPNPDPRWVQGRLLPAAPAKKSSGFDLDLERVGPIDRLRLNGIRAPFIKRARIDGSLDRVRWSIIVAEGTLFDLPAEKLRQLEFEFSPTQCRYLRVTWDDNASERVPLPGTALVRQVSAGALPPPLVIPVEFERRTAEPGRSRFRLRLPGPHLPLTAIELATAGGNVLREARVSEARLAGGEMIPHVLGTAMLRRTVRGDVAATELRIPISPPREAQLDLTIEDGNNPPFQLAGATAVFAYLPWIYFDAPSAEPLTVRFGHPGLAAPRYDLEAMRDSIEKTRTSEARWGELRARQREAESPEINIIPASGAPVDLAAFRFSRKIPAGKPGLNALLLDAAILAHSRLADLRIAGKDGRQIPYLMEKMEEPLSIDLPAPEKAAPPGRRPGQADLAVRSYYRLKLPYENLPPSSLVLATSARIFRRELSVLVEKNPANDRQEPWTMHVVSAPWIHAEPDTPAPALTLRLPSLKTAEAMLVVEEGDNSPLPIASVKLLLVSYRMRFFRSDDADLTLFYGQDNLAPPRYDLALLASRLAGAAAEEISPAPESASPPTKGEALPKSLFWGILIAAVLVLMALIARLVKKSESG